MVTVKTMCSKLALIVVTILFAFSTVQCSSLFPDIEIPVYKTGYDVKKGINKKFKSKYTFYKINSKFPAKEVIEFYHTNFKRMGFIQYSEDGYGKGRWENFDSNSGQWEPTNSMPARYIATWIDNDKKIRIVVLLRYKSDQIDDEGKNLLFVDCKVVDFFDSRKM